MHGPAVHSHLSLPDHARYAWQSAGHSGAPGERVTRGQRVAIIEAMKMEHTLTAPFDGKLAELNAKPGAQVSEGVLLAKLEAIS